MYLNLTNVMFKLYFKHNVLLPDIQDLVKDLDSELSGDFKETIQALMMTPADLDAHSLNKAMQGMGCDEAVLIDIICTKSAAELEEIKKEFKNSKI